jgi:hypothetical protein
VRQAARKYQLGKQARRQRRRHEGGAAIRIKWNARSFFIDDDDRITFWLQPGDRVQLIFHRGAMRRDDATTFSFEDRSGLLEWVAKDRAVVTFHDLGDVKAKSAALKDLVRRWMTATRERVNRPV